MGICNDDYDRIDTILLKAESANLLPQAKQALASWLRDNQIQASAGASKVGISELKYTWGVKSLP